MPSPNVRCASCGRPIHRSPARLAASKTGLFWCRSECRRVWRTVGGAPYRKTAFDAYPPRCDECGWDRIPAVLEVHHVDYDHGNDRLENLRILCPTCHRTVHWETKTESEADSFPDPDWE